MNSVLVDITGSGYAPTSSFSMNTSNLLTIQKGNSLYVNEVGNDSKNGTLDMTNNQIINVSDPLNAKDAVNKGYVDSSLQTITLSGDKITTGTINKDRLPTEITVSKISGLADPVEENNAVNKKYVDGHLNKQEDDAKDASNITSGTINKDRLPTKLNKFSVEKIIGLSKPQTDSEAVNKAYVDGSLQQERNDYMKIFQSIANSPQYSPLDVKINDLTGGKMNVIDFGIIDTYPPPTERGSVINLCDVTFSNEDIGTKLKNH